MRREIIMTAAIHFLMGKSSLSETKDSDAHKLHLIPQHMAMKCLPSKKWYINP